MSEIAELIATYNTIQLLDEDENSLELTLNEPCNIDQIAEFEVSNQCFLPQQLKDFLLTSDGMNFFGLNLLSIKEIQINSDKNIASFHNWGNGDFDCISLTFPYEIIFCSGSSQQKIEVCSSLLDWIKGAFLEIKQKGTLLHPLDYSYREERGLYDSIFN